MSYSLPNFFLRYNTFAFTKCLVDLNKTKQRTLIDILRVKFRPRPPFNIFKISMCFKYIRLFCYFVEKLIQDIPVFFIFHGSYPIYLHSLVNDVKSDAFLAIQSKSVKNMQYILIFFLNWKLVQFWTRKNSFLDRYIFVI